MKKAFFGLTALLSVFAVAFLFAATAQAATIIPSTIGLNNAYFVGAPIKASSNPTAIVKLSISASANGKYLSAVTVNFSGTGTFATTTLANIAADAASGVALYSDSGGSLGSVVATSTSWTAGTSNITLTAIPAISIGTATSTFYVVIRTSAAAANNDQIIATIPANGVVTNDAAGATGPAANFTANSFKLDTVAPTITAVTGSIGSANLTVGFSEPVQKAGGGNLTANQFTFVDNGTVTTHSTSTVSHTAGQVTATVTLTAAADSGDFADTASTLSAATGGIADMAGNLITPAAVNLTSPISITTAAIPATYKGATYTLSPDAPLVNLAAAGGSGSYVWATSTTADGTNLEALGLTINPNGKLYAKSAVSQVTGNYFISFRATDAADNTASTTKYLQINIAAASGSSTPAISGVSPGGGAQNSAPTITITGLNTSFSGSSAVTISLSPELSGTNGITPGTVSALSATSLSAPLAIASDATAGSRDIKITTGSQVVFMSHAFTVFAAGGSGLNLNMPASGATNISVSPPPNFNFNPSTTNGVNSYRLTIKPDAGFSGTALWDFVFPSYSFAPTFSSCSATACNVSYGAGQGRPITQPSPLAANTTYYWNVRTYSQSPDAVSDSAIPLDSTIARGFTTTASVTDSVPPSITHRTIFSATVNAELNVFARVVDNLAKANTTPALSSYLYYCKTAACTPDTEITGSDAGNGYYKYTISAGNMNQAQTRYWLKATDGVNTTWFKGPSNAAFQINTYPAGAQTITGHVYDNASAAINNATVFAEGTGFTATTDADGVFTLSNLPSGMFDLMAIKDGYADRQISGVPAGMSGISFSLPSGGCGGFGGDTTKPRIKFSGPPDGQSGIPGGASEFKIFVGFSKSMSNTSITTAGNMYVKELNPSTGATTDITTTKGNWAYYDTSPPAGGPQDNYLAIWSFSAGQTFGDNKTILVIITPNVTDTANNQIQGNQPDGSYAFSFTTGSTANFSGFNQSTGQFQGGGTFGQGQFTPPFVTGSTPAPGMFDVPVNQKIVINFSEAMSDDGGDYSLKNYIKPYALSGSNPPFTATAVAAAGYSVSLDTSKKIATVTITGNMTASTRYRVAVLGGAKASTGITLSPPNQAANQMYMTEFKTSSSGSGDTAAPTITGIFPAGGASQVNTNFGAVNVGFSKDMDASTITTSNFYLSVGSNAVNGTVEYRTMDRQAYFVPKNSLNATTTYTINLTADVKALNGQALAATTSVFSTATADTGAPSVSFINADDYSLAITFTEPMNAAKAVDTLNYASSTLKPSLYTIKQAASNAQNGTAVTLGETVALSYDYLTNTVMIKGLSLTAGNEVYVSVGGVKDAAGNLMTSGNTAKATVQSSATTKGMLGPMAMSTDAFSMGGDFTPTNFSANTFGFAPPVEARPFSMMTNQTTIYHLGLPIAKQIPAGGTIVLTFPTGFDVSGAKQDVNSPMRGDLNGPGPSTIKFKCNSSAVGGKTCSGDDTITGDSAAETSSVGGLADDGVTINATARAITITVSADTNPTGFDFLSLDIAGIKNSAVPKDFNTTGYTVDIKTKNGTTLLESLTSQPFFIQAGGSYNLSGTITATGASDNTATAKIYLMSPMTGPMDTTVTFNAGASDGTTASYSFTGLSNGEYFIFTDPSVTLGATEFVGKPMPERVSIAGGNQTYNFSLANADSGTTVTLQVRGPANEPIDIFANSPSGFKVKSATLDGTATNYDSISFKLADGQWMVGVGPQMPKGPTGGMAATPSYLPPQPVNVLVQSSGSPTVVENSDTANDGTLTFTLVSANKYIKGTVKDGAGKVMANAEVYAYSPQGGMGTHGQTATDGTFSLSVIDGTYAVGAFVPGMPPSKEVPVVVSSDSSAYLFIDGAVGGITAAAAQTAFILKVAKPDYTISGKVTDGTNVVQGAAVYAYRTDGPGGSSANTDSSGNYTLYVSSGTWKVGVFLPQYGNLTEQTVSITTASAANQNFSPTNTGTFSAVSGNVTVGGTNKQGAFVRINGNNTFNEAITGSDGNYSFKVPQGSGYVIKVFVPGMGEVAATSAFNVSGDTTKDFAIGAARTITILTSTSISKAFIEFMSSAGIGGHAEITNATSTSLSLPNGSYKVMVNIPGVELPLTAIAGTTGDTAYATSTGVGIITVNGNEGLTITVPTLRTVSGTTSVGEAWVEMINPSNGIHFGAKSASTTPYSFSLQVVDSSTDYIINAMKPGLYRDPSTLTVNGSNQTSLSLALSPSTLNISGQVKIGSSEAANAFVRAEKQGGGFSGTQADANGNYTLPVTAGTWKVYGVAEGYAETAYGSNIVVSGASVSGKDISLSTTVSLTPPKSKPITPSSGGTIDDPAAGLKLTMPANSLKTQDTSAANVQTKETNNVRSTSNSKPINNKAIEITAVDADNNPIKNLSDSVIVEMSYTPAELATTPSASDSSVNTKTEADKLQMAYWDETTATWVTLPSTVTYYKSDGTVLDGSDAAHTPAADLSNVATTTVSAPTTHFSLYAPVSATEGAPATPAAPSASVISSSQIDLSWSAVSGATSYDLYRSDTSGGTYALVGSEPTTTGTTYSDTSLSSGTAYYYKLTSINASGESAPSTAVTATTQAVAGGSVIQSAPSGSSPSSPSTTTTTTTTTTPTTPTTTTPTTTTTQTTTATQQIQTILAEAATVSGGTAGPIASAMGVAVSASAESAAEKKYTNSLVSTSVTAGARTAITNFIVYGTPTTKILGAGERAGVVNSYKSAFGKTPATEADWADVIKIGNGRWPSQQSAAAETKAKTEFKKVYLRSANMNQANDNAAVTVIAYGLRPTARNLTSEKAAIKSFKAIYGHAPVSALAWDIVRSIAYSGAKR